MSTVIKIENLSKRYRLGLVGTNTLHGDIKQWWAKMRGREEDLYKIGEENKLSEASGDYVWALRDINLEVKQGEVLGIIGKNGAGKSTLLKLLSRVTGPTTGSINVKGRIASLLEVGTGFHPELTGRENIYLNGAILGMKRHEINRKFDEIVEFAGVAKYIDTPVKRYSSGMYVRLAFAVAAHLEPEILIVDEVLAVGDAEFQKKAIGKMQDVSTREGRTVLFVSHNMAAVQELCSEAILMNNGTIRRFGKPRELIEEYMSLGKIESSFIRSASSESDAYIKEIFLSNESGTRKSEFLYNENITLNFKIKIKINKNYSLFCLFFDKKYNRIFSAESMEIKENMKLTIEPKFLVRGNYHITAFINVPRHKQIDLVENTCKFSVIDSGSEMAKHGTYDYGSVFGRYSWQLY